MVKNPKTSTHPIYCFLPINRQLQVPIPLWSTAEQLTVCPLLKSKLHLHFQIMLTSKCILNTHQQGKQEANKLRLKHLPETCSRILTALYNTDNTSKHDSK